ncbi:MAG: hypothetical protein AUH43_23850 [Acidobacteria bacterium 13_1_40CM_65_14]|nr:MAG: hypothetical protein AUH43_23850 [Acidobacteria bacterium 13_1_40CM_65_14]
MAAFRIVACVSDGGRQHEGRFRIARPDRSQHVGRLYHDVLARDAGERAQILVMPTLASSAIKLLNDRS